MALADDLKTLARNVRAIPGQFGIRPHRVYLVTDEWDGPYYGDGALTREQVELVEGDNQPPKVRQLNDERRALGDLAGGSVEIGPVTPPDAGSVAASAFRGADLTNGFNGLKLRIVGPTGDALYVIKGLDLSRAIHWTITAEPLQSTPPDAA
jgi:hypothetical protein